MSLRIGFLSTFDPDNPDRLSGMPASMKQALVRQGCEVVNLVPPTPPMAPLQRIGGKLRSLSDRVRKKLGSTTTGVPAEFMDPSRAYDAFLARASRRSQAASALLRAKLDEGQEFDILFGCCISTLLCELDTDLPIVYFSDTTANQINTTYSRYSTRPDGYKRASDETEAAGLQRASAAVFATRLAAHDATHHYGVSEGQVHTVPLGANVDGGLEMLSPDQIEVPTRDSVRLMITAVDPIRKRIDLVVEAAEILRRRGYHATLSVVGCPTAKAKESEVVTFADFLKLSDPAGRARHEALLAESHFMVLPSLAEAFGIAICEAAHFATPSIASDAGGLKEAVQHQRTGWVLPVDQGAEAYAQAIQDLVDDPERYRELAMAAWRRARTELTWDHWGARLVEIMQGVLSKPPESRPSEPISPTCEPAITP